MDVRDDASPERAEATKPRSLRKLEKEESSKKLLLKKIHDRDLRVAEIIAKKEQDHAMRKKEKEAEKSHKQAMIEQIKEQNELKRIETMKRIIEKEKRAEEVRKDREEQAILGRQSAVDVRGRLERILRTSYLNRNRDRSARLASASSRDLQRNVLSRNNSSNRNVNTSEVQSERDTPEQESNFNDIDHDENVGDKAGLATSFENYIEKSLTDTSLGQGTSDGTLELEQADEVNEEIIEAKVQEKIWNDLEELQSKVSDLEDIVNAQSTNIEQLHDTVTSWKLKSVLIIMAFSFILNRSSRGSNSGASKVMTASVQSLPAILSMCFDSQSGKPPSEL